MVDSLSQLYVEHHRALRDRYAAGLDRGPWAGAIVASGQPAPIFGDDQPHPYRVDPRFRQWIPEGDYENSYVLVRRGDRPQLICCRSEDYWHAPAPEPAGFWADHFDIAPVATSAEAERALPRDIDKWAYLGDPSFCPSGLPIECVNPAALVQSLDYYRVYKNDYEVACIRQASRVAAAGHLAARAAFEDGASELDIHLAYLAATRVLERQLPYANIVALNEHGATLHYDALETAPPAVPVSLLIDAGAQYLGYAADITRTWSKDKEFSELVARVDEAQQRLIDRIAVGMSFVDLHLEMHIMIGAVLAEAGLVAMSPESMVEAGVTSAFFPHGLGHHLGLQVHDVGGKLADDSGTPLAQPEGHPFLRNLRPLEPGNVITIEPGLYFIRPLLEALRSGSSASQVRWDRVESYLPFGGVRVEDDVFISKNGVENLTRDAFLALEE